jgi:hypothetical protein
MAPSPRCLAAGEGYGTGLPTNRKPSTTGKSGHPLIAILPLIMVGVMNKVFTDLIPVLYGEKSFLHSGGDRQGRAGGATNQGRRRDLGGRRRACWWALRRSSSLPGKRW